MQTKNASQADPKNAKGHKKMASNRQTHKNTLSHMFKLYCHSCPANITVCTGIPNYLMHHCVSTGQLKHLLIFRTESGKPQGKKKHKSSN